MTDELHNTIKCNDTLVRIPMQYADKAEYENEIKAAIIITEVNISNDSSVHNKKIYPSRITRSYLSFGKILPVGSRGLVILRSSSSVSLSLPSVCFSSLIGLSSYVAISTGSEDATETTSVVLVDEAWTSTSHYVTILQLSDFVVKAHSMHSSFVSNSLSSSVEDLSFLDYLCVMKTESLEVKGGKHDGRRQRELLAREGQRVVSTKKGGREKVPPALFALLLQNQPNSSSPPPPNNLSISYTFYAFLSFHFKRKTISFLTHASLSNQWSPSFSYPFLCGALRMANCPGDSTQTHLDILRCPFLRNINEPTNLSFSSSSLPFPIPVRAGQGPIFEDGPNFDTAFRLFHGQDGVVPLSDSPRARADKPSLSSPAFHPLAAKAATISLSSFGHGGPFGFDAFSDLFKNQKRKSDSSKNKDSSSSKGGNHESMSDDWLQTGNCPIAKSYRAVSGVAPLVAKILQPPPGMQYKCPKAIVAARAAISKTAFAKNLRPQPLSSKVLVIGMLGMALNVPLGVWREHTEKFSASWFVALHAAVPFIGILRKSVLMPKMAMVFTIAASVMGQVIGSRAERYRLKSVAHKKLSLTGPDHVDGRCGDKVVMKWNPMLLEVASPVSTGAASVVC
ncbi:unnamed protein product [Brassica napus]|nr:unnamed protein product [Brassica napus]